MPDTTATDPPRRALELAVPALAAYTTVVMALLVRTFLLPSDAYDYDNFLEPWYRHIASHGGFHALADTGFSDYNVPYLYLLAALTHLPLPALAGIKWMSVLFEPVLAYYTFRIVSLFRPSPSWAALGSAAVVLFLPTVVTNGAWLAQCDAIYVAFLTGGIHHLLRHRPWWACAFFGIALAFKIQAVFLFPFLLVLVLVGRVPWRCLLAVPAAYLALDVPALALGADPGWLLTVYARQTGEYQSLTLYAPSVYQFVSVPGDTGAVRTAGVLVAGALVSLLAGLAVWSLRRGRAGTRDSGQAALRCGPSGRDSGPAAGGLTDTRILLLAACTSIVVPFLLPSMHERYFYAAEVLTVVTAFRLPRQLWYAPVLVQLASFGSYLKCNSAELSPYLSMPAHGALMLLALIAVLRTTVREFRHGPFGTTDVPGPAAPGKDTGTDPAAPGNDTGTGAGEDTGTSPGEDTGRNTAEPARA
ncbi:DUF2029 domain-containing protein [Streptomyces sp. 5-8]|uniref:DUF2029 domain-containing protein n=1 Tax=Streptomyces musisoli TaxID=2802280 RepID=A0ABS1P1D3_9ACTN|nr:MULTISPECIES: glycosyltransferase 87 family protein [Streptomyces]MBL1105862.1 DUF2029 domain-containing protein [Streptomyces musisoli]MBY8841750.1 glycosyltransferase 87 family protein [Streptomyces sp. SP2-10]